MEPPLEPDVSDLAAAPGVPAQRRAAEPPRLIDQEQDKLERVREADKSSSAARGESDRRVAGVESSAEATVG